MTLEMWSRPVSAWRRSLFSSSSTTSYYGKSRPEGTEIPQFSPASVMVGSYTRRGFRDAVELFDSICNELSTREPLDILLNFLGIFHCCAESVVQQHCSRRKPSNAGTLRIRVIPKRLIDVPQSGIELCYRYVCPW